MAELIRNLARRGHNLKLIAFLQDTEHPEELRPLYPYLQAARCFPAVQRRGERDPFRLLPVNFRWPEVMGELALDLSWADVAHFEYLDTAHLKPEFCPVPTVLTHHEIQTETWLDYASRAPICSKERVVCIYRAARAYRLETLSLRRFSRVVALTEQDQDALFSLDPRASVALSRMGVDLKTFTPHAGPGEAGSLLYVGYYRHRPNADAALWLAKEIFPLIKQERPEATLTLAGSHPTPEILALAGKDIRVPGWVHDLRPLYAQAQVFVAPIRTGRGMRGKLLEALAMERPVVATTLAAAGLGALDGVQLRLADKASDFAKAVVQVMEHPEQAARMAEQGRKRAETFGWDRIAEDYESLFYEVVDECRKA